MSAEALALVVEDPSGGYLAADSRSGWPISCHGDLMDANAVAAYLNSTYPIVEPCPARDSLVHEVVCLRRAARPPLRLETLSALGRLEERCPAVGPGQGHPSEGAR